MQLTAKGAIAIALDKALRDIRGYDLSGHDISEIAEDVLGGLPNNWVLARIEHSTAPHIEIDEGLREDG